jgi:hypothetical protein
MREASQPAPPVVVASRPTWRKHDADDEARLRRFARPKIEGVLDTLPDASGIDLWLALGKECPFSAQWQRTIWCDEIERVIRERVAAAAERRKT